MVCLGLSKNVVRNVPMNMFSPYQSREHMLDYCEVSRRSRDKVSIIVITIF